MCGIIGYTGNRAACGVILDGLARLEYRGYDSAGLSVAENGELVTVKAKGRLSNLRDKLANRTLAGTCGIGHTRWATHGGPSDVNSHPHATQKLTMVHNGIIENYLDLKRKLSAKGYEFTSQTDTEIAACLIDFHYDGDPVAAIRESLGEIEGSYALLLIFADHPHTLYAVRKDGPLIVALGEGENFVASDVTAVIGYTNRYFTLDEGEIAVITPEKIEVLGENGEPHKKQVRTVDWNVEQAQKDGYDHFMLKEIHEQPTALLSTIHPRVKEGQVSFAVDQIPDAFFSSFDRIRIVACGSAMYAGMIGRTAIEALARIPVEVEVASEFRYRDPVLSKKELLIIVSQSGETADTLAALRLGRQMGLTTLAIVNVAGSSIAREADYVIHTFAGPEISVASTKAYSVQIAVLYLLAFAFARAGGKLDDDDVAELTGKLVASVDAVKDAISQKEAIREAAKEFVEVEHLFFIGRGADFALSCEGALKLKEISYIHCEPYAAGELKHGPISLITEGVPVIALATQQRLMAKTLSNIKEVKARGAKVLLIAKEDESVSHDAADRVITLKSLDDMFMPFPAVAVLQLIAYYTAAQRGCDIDKPRNLAKSVTVE